MMHMCMVHVVVERACAHASAVGDKTNPRISGPLSADVSGSSCVSPASLPKSQLNGFERAAEAFRSALQLVAEVFPKSFPLQGESVPEMVPIAWPKSHRKGFHCAAQAIPK